jgi:TolB-like protein/DNA-binding winged helix-turn-helix (wHTH) protein
MLHINGWVPRMTKSTAQLLKPEFGPAGLHPRDFRVSFSSSVRRRSGELIEEGGSPQLTATSQRTYLVDDLEVNPSHRTVTRDGAEIRVGKLTFDLLMLLVEESPEIVTQDTIADRLWNKRHVTQDTVRQRVESLRRALGDDPDEPRYFNVVRGQGYRLIPEVRFAGSDTNLPATLGNPWASVTAIALCVLLSASQLRGIPEDLTNSDAMNAIPSTIAVLPFENLSGDSADTVFVEGFHNDLLTQLAKLESFDVISRTSVLGYRENKKNLRQIGQELDVATILEGSIQRSGNTVRINAQLIDAHDDTHIWANLYDRELTTENLFDIQSEMVAAIAGGLKIELSRYEPERPESGP